MEIFTETIVMSNYSRLYSSVRCKRHTPASETLCDCNVVVGMGGGWDFTVILAELNFGTFVVLNLELKFLALARL